MLRKNILKLSVVFCLLAACLWIYLPSSYAEDSHALPMLRMGVGARGLAMGGAYVAAVGDASASIWNPAGLADIEYINLTSMYSAEMAFDRSLNYFGFGMKFDWGALGISWLNSGMKDLVGYNSGDVSTGLFDYMTNVFVFSYANKAEKLGAGASFKVITEKIDEESKTGVGLDLGLKLQANEIVTLGVAVKDLGTKVWGKSVPTNIRAGVALCPMNGFVFPLDIVKIVDRDGVTFHLGGEYKYEFTKNYFASVRAGVSDEKFSIGCGFTISKVDIDYSFVTETEEFLGENHRISLSVNF